MMAAQVLWQDDETVKVALVHDWLVAHRGGENVLMELATLFPQAPIYTLVYDREKAPTALSSREVHTSWLQKLPFSEKHFRKLLPLMPRAIESFDLSSYDLILSTSHCVAKGILTHQNQVHLSYIHTPMRYIWDQMPHYLPGRLPKFVSHPLARVATIPLRQWDRKSGQRPTTLLANSGFVAERIERCWGREASVVYPPVDITRFKPPSHQTKKSYFLVVSALVPYKNNALAVAWASKHGESLKVVGSGSEYARLRSMAGPSVEFVGALDSVELVKAYQGARALLFCGIEDFGIVPLEAMAAGCPVIALARGGALETVSVAPDLLTGVFFREPNLTALETAIHQFRKDEEEGRFVPERMYGYTQRFSPARFRDEVCRVLQTMKIAKI